MKENLYSSLFFLFFFWSLFQVSVEAPWLSNIPASCVVVGQGMLMCVDSTTASLNTLNLQQSLQITQIPLQVSSKQDKKRSAL